MLHDTASAAVKSPEPDEERKEENITDEKRRESGESDRQEKLTEPAPLSQEAKGDVEELQRTPRDVKDIV